jgi:5-methyltetrahydropteroyltriglutamate--homocysteine methyltransferase
MNRSTDRILTTHVGSLPRPADLIALYQRGATGPELDACLDRSVHDVVRLQTQAGIDVVNDGEHAKPVRGETDYGAWLVYASARMGGFEPRPLAPQLFPGKDRADFRAFYEVHAAETGESSRPIELVCTGPVTYMGQEQVARDAARLKAALDGASVKDAFIPVVSAVSLECLQPNEYYKTQEEYAWALAEALKQEYEAVARTGFILQVDEPGTFNMWDFRFALADDLASFRKFAEARYEMLNYSLSNIPEEQIRVHSCWGSWHGPHASDIPLEKIIDLVVKIKAGAHVIEAANVRHEHDWKVWRDAKLPEGRILIPGVVSHATNLLEHPEVIADRIIQYANVVGRENVIAGTDCGLGGRIHPQLAWAKLKALSEGAALASKRLW